MSSNEENSSNQMVADRDAFYFTENLSPHFGVKMSLKSIMFTDTSSFQKVQVIETHQFGKTLVMDGQTQSAEADEHIYHESLVHPAMLLHPNPKNVFIGGGGEFATAREVLRHKSVEKCTMVDIDELACDMCRKHLPEWNAGAFEDPRLEVAYTDAKKWLEDHAAAGGKKFDVIIMDIVDPIEAGPGYLLYTTEFYTFLKEVLTDDGIFVTQSGPCAVFNAKSECFTVINATLRQSFSSVAPYGSDIPSFGSNWGFNIATNSSQNVVQDMMTKEDVDEVIAQRIEGELKFLDAVSFKGVLGLPKSIRKECAEEDRVMTIENPVFMYAG